MGRFITKGRGERVKSSMKTSKEKQPKVWAEVENEVEEKAVVTDKASDFHGRLKT